MGLDERDSPAGLTLCDTAFFEKKRNSPAFSQLQQIARRELERDGVLMYPHPDRFGDRLIYDSVYNDFADAINRRYGIRAEVQQSPPKEILQTSISQAFKKLYPPYRQFLTRMPIQEVLLNELGCAYGIDTSGIDVDKPLTLRELRGEHIDIYPEIIAQEGEHISQQINRPIIVVYQAGSNATKRLPRERIITLGRQIKTTFPDTHLVITTDGQEGSTVSAVQASDVDFADTFLRNPDTTVLGPWSYAASVVIGTDTGWAWYSTSCMAYNPKNDRHIQPNDAFFLYTVSNPEVWGIPGATHIVSPAVKNALELRPDKIHDGVFLQTTYAPSYYTDHFYNNQMSGNDTPIHPSDLDMFEQQVLQGLNARF